MELIITPPRIAIKFRISLLHSLLTVTNMLHIGQKLEGVSDWVNRHLHHADTLNPLIMLNIFATGIQGYLIDTIRQEDAANTDFDALLQHLEHLDPSQLQEAAYQSLYESLLRQEILAPSAPLDDMLTKLPTLLEQVMATYQDRWDLPPLMSPTDFADLLTDAIAIHHALLDGLQYLWQSLYHSQANEDMAQQKIALAYHLSQHYPSDFATIFRAATGRQVSDFLQQRLSKVTVIEMIPTSHVGANITVSLLANKIWIGFNANLTPLSNSKSAPPIAELYPALKALADEVRLKIMTLLIGQELSVGEIADAMNLTQSTASRHLTLLAKTDILHVRPDGATRYYRVNADRLKAIGQQLQQLPS